MTAQPSGLLTFLPLLFLTLVPALTVFFLAKDKGRNVLLCTLLGIIPFLNLGVLLYLIGATNLKMASKLDEIVALLSAKE